MTPKATQHRLSQRAMEGEIYGKRRRREGEEDN
jgi:hypothetical protein